MLMKEFTQLDKNQTKVFINVAAIIWVKQHQDYYSEVSVGGKVFFLKASVNEILNNIRKLNET